MKALDLKEIYHKNLDTIYGKVEVESLFFLALEHFLDVPRIQLSLDKEFTIKKSEIDEFFNTLNDLKNQKPIQYIFGETEFFCLKFKVNKSVLIPRQETEELVALILQNSASIASEAIRILDIGTGSGIIAISLAKELPNAEVYALDITKEALEVAKHNAERNNVNVHFLLGDILDSKQMNLLFEDLTFDIIVSNPPYVRNLEKAEIQPNVLDHEPHVALFVDDDDPLVFYNAITNFSVEKLGQNGQLFFEINQYLGQETMQLLVDRNFEAIELLKDLNGNDRMLKGTLK